MTFSFGDIEIDAARRVIRRSGEPVSAEPKVLDLLLQLVRHRDRVVRREELQDKLWPRTAVSDAALYQVVKEARRAIGDDGRQQRWIRTVYGEGLRFVGSVRVTGAPETRPTRPTEGEGTRGRHARPPFVGRRAALARIERSLARACEQQPTIVLLSAEAGMGKTRTALEVAERARARGVRALWGRGTRDPGSPVFWPFIQILRELARESPRWLADESSAVGVLSDLVPELRVGLAPGTVAPPLLDSDQTRFRLFDSVARLLHRGAAHEPLLLLLDDLQWFDASSLGLLAFLARELGEARILVLGMVRPLDGEHGDASRRALAEAHRAPGFDELELAGLTRHETRELIATLWDEALAVRLASRVYESTEGNPLFVQETVRHLVERGLSDAPLARGASPGVARGVRDVIEQRLERLSDDARRLLSVASVLGQSFSLARLRALGEATSDDVDRAIDEASAARVVAEEGPGSERYAFSHALFREVLYDGFPPRRRSALHRAAARELRARLADDDGLLLELAHHEAAGAREEDAVRVAELVMRAGDHAAAKSAHEDAALLYERALGLLPRRERDLRCEAEIALASCEFRAGQRPRGEAAVARATRLALELRSPEHFARALLAEGASGLGLLDPLERDDAKLELLEQALDSLPMDADPERLQLRSRLLSRLAMHHHWTGDVRRAIVAAEEGAELARRHEPAAARALALASLHASLAGTPDAAAQSPPVAEEMLASARESGAEDAELMCRALRLRSLATQGAFAEVAAEIAILGDLAARLRQPQLLWWARTPAVSLALIEGRFDAARRGAVEVFELGRDLGGPTAAGMRLAHELSLATECGGLEALRPAYLEMADRHPSYASFSAAAAWLCAESGDESTARRLLARLARDGFEGIRRDSTWGTTLALAALTSSRLGEAAPARELYRLLAPQGERHVVFGFASILYYGPTARYLARLARCFGDRDAAVAHGEAALEMLERSPAAPARAWLRHELAAALRERAARGDAARAAALARQAAADAQRLGMLRLAREIDC